MVSRALPPGLVYHPADITAYDVAVSGYNGDAVPAYVARPSEGGPHPGLLLVHGIHGYEEHMKDMARRYAALGYAAIVPALYSRDGFLAVVEHSDLDLARDALNSRPNAQTVGDLQGGLEYLRASRHVSKRIGLVGFCSGGRLGLVFASSPDLGAGPVDVFVDFYSNGLFQPTEANPTPPGELATGLGCPMLALFGDDDTNPSPGDVDRPPRGAGTIRQDLRVRQLPKSRTRIHVRHPRELPTRGRPDGLGPLPRMAVPLPETLNNPEPRENNR